MDTFLFSCFWVIFTSIENDSLNVFNWKLLGVRSMGFAEFNEAYKSVVSNSV